MSGYRDRLAAAQAEGRTWLTTADVAPMFRVRSETVKTWCRDGRLPGSVKTPGGHWRIPVTSVEHYAGRLHQTEKERNARR